MAVILSVPLFVRRGFCCCGCGCRRHVTRRDDVVRVVVDGVSFVLLLIVLQQHRSNRSSRSLFVVVTIGIVVVVVEWDDIRFIIFVNGGVGMCV